MTNYCTDKQKIPEKHAENKILVHKGALHTEKKKDGECKVQKVKSKRNVIRTVYV